MNGDWHETQALGAQVRRLRSLRRLSVEQLAAIAEIDVRELIDAELGREISALLLSRIAIALELPLEAFFHIGESSDCQSHAQILQCVSRLNSDQKREVATLLIDIVDDVRIRRDWQPVDDQPTESIPD